MARGQGGIPGVLPGDSPDRRHFEIAQPGGIVEAWRGPADSADVIYNMRQDGLHCWCEAGGYTKVIPDGQVVPFTNVDRVETLFSWTQSANRRWTMCEVVKAGETSARMWVLDYSTSIPLELEVGRQVIGGPWAKTQYLAQGGWVTYLNGHDNPRRWDGRHLALPGFTARPPPVGVSWLQQVDLVGRWSYGFPAGSPTDHGWNLSTARGLGDWTGLAADGTVTQWTYGYAVTYVNERGQESPPSVVQYVSGSNLGDLTGNNDYKTGKTYAKVDIAAGPVQGNVRCIRLWRTANVYGASASSQAYAALFLHTEFPSSVELSICDGKPDRELGQLLDTNLLGLWPVGVRLIASFASTVFLAGAPQYPDRLYYSAPGAPEQFPAQNYFDLGSKEAGEIRGMHALKGALLVWKTRGIYLVAPDANGSLQVSTLTEDVGSCCPNAAYEVPGVGVVFLSEAGIYALKNSLNDRGQPTDVEDITGPIRRTWMRRVNRSSLVAAVGVINHKDRELWLQVPSGGRRYPDLGLVLHYDIGEWSFRQGYPIECMTEVRGPVPYVLFGSWDSTQRGVWVYARGYNLNGTAVAPTYVTTWMDFGFAFQRNDIHNLDLVVQNTGRTINVAFAINRDPAIIDTQTFLASTRERAVDLWDTALWGVGTWGDYHATPAELPVRAEVALSFQAQITGDKLRIITTGGVQTPDSPSLFPPLADSLKTTTR